MADFDFFNSKEVEWVDMSILFSGFPMIKFQGIDWKPTQAKELLYAEGNQPIGIQKGQKGYSGNLKLLKGALDVIRLASIAAGGEGPLDIEFDIVVKFRAKGGTLGRPLQVTTLVSCQFTEVPEGWENTATSMSMTLPFIYLRQKSA